jgi:hypothetical protein
MRSLLIILGGLVLLGLGLLVGRWIGGAGTHAMATVAKILVIVWLAISLLNMWIGVSRAGYSVAEEFPIFAMIFIIPAGAALLLWWKFS